MPYIVSLDFGSTTAKCLIFDTNGNKLVQIKKEWGHHQIIREQNHRSCFDDQTAWKVIADCCREAIQVSGLAVGDIACVIPTSQRHGAIILDKTGNYLFAFMNDDERSAPPWDQITARYSHEIYSETGRWPQNVFLPAHLFWLRENHPEISKKIATIMGIQDWLVYRLSGQMVSETTIAGDLLLLNIKKREWSSSIIDLCDLKLSMLPSLVEAGIRVGSVTPAAAKATGLLTGTPVLNGAADSQMALIGSGALKYGDVVIAFGTSIPVLYLTDCPILHPEGVTWTNSHIFPQEWVLESNSGDAGLCLDRFCNLFLPKLISPSGLPPSKDLPTLSELDQWLTKLDVRKSLLLASWGPVIFNGKKWPKVNGLVKGMSLLENKEIGLIELYYSLVENIGFAIRGNLMQLIHTAGRESNRVYIGGSATETRVWQRLLSGILGIQLMVPKEKEVTPLGAAALAASKIGMYEDIQTAASNMVQLSEVSSDEDLADFYKDRYTKWLDVYLASISQES